KLVCLFNPVLYLWNRWIMEIQEFACDETLLGRKKVESREYARCLVEVAQTAIHRNRAPVCATGFTFLIERNLLKRRIENMLIPKTNRDGRGLMIAAAVLFAMFMGTIAFASKGLVQDRRVTMEQAKAMAARAGQGSEVPVVVNDLVLKQLN